jgi:hypothetical protein
LTEQLQQNLIAPDYREKVKNAIEKGVKWILKTRQKQSGNFWSDCPNSNSQTQSNGLNGFVIYALHIIAKSESVQIQNLVNELKEIDSLWLDYLSKMPRVSVGHAIGCRCGTITNDDVILDRTNQWSIPWAIMATIEAFPNGSNWQKAAAANWVENLPFSEKYEGYYAGASEYLIALSHLRTKDTE